MLDYQNIVLGRTLSRDRTLGDRHERAGMRLGNSLRQWQQTLSQLARRAAGQATRQVTGLNRQRLRERRT